MVSSRNDQEKVVKLKNVRTDEKLIWMEVEHKTASLTPKVAVKLSFSFHQHKNLKDKALSKPCRMNHENIFPFH